MSYHDRPERSSSEVARFLDDPIAWYHEYVLRDWKRETTEAMKFGTEVHAMIEHRSSDAIVRVIPDGVLNADGHRKGKAWKDWEAENPALVYVKEGEPNPFGTIWNHLLANSWTRDIIMHAEKEVEHVWDDEDMGPSRVKMDAVYQTYLVDWKTTSKSSERGFASEVFDRHYDVRLAFYRKGFRDLFKDDNGEFVDPEVYVVFIETSGGYKVTPYRLPDEWLDEAEAKLIITVEEMKRFNLEAYLDCEPKTLQKPRYATFDLENIWT